MSLWNLPPVWELHPATVHFPIGLLLAGVVLELYAWWRGRQELAQIAYGILVAGVLTGVLAASSGFLAFYTLPATHTEEAHTIMYWHLWLQVAALVVFTSVVLVRWRLRQRAPAGVLRITGLVAAGLLVVGSYLGGHLVYRGATGIDPSLLSPALREGHHHDGEGHERPASPPQHEPDHGHTHSHEDSHAH
ncbi:MAG: hypothetical protein A3J79_09175 [Elusimicrobia bacterium RIFOXYB2_FULL_62_6]|nr:MAG: hypothetical protein A3J79_09175 [Elusimicrobia bacterium RIFOXYB2_FULL_62_6]